MPNSRAVGKMVMAMPKYAFIDGREVVLAEVIPHVFQEEVVCVFTGNEGGRQYVSREEWERGADEFARFTATNRIVTSESASRAKIALFRSMFKGREDVYAHGYVKRQGGIGYSPACANERTGRCPRWTKSNPKVKCATCSARKFASLSDQALVEHFKGNSDGFHDVLGLYVLLADCRTWVLVADFDKEGWQREAAAYRDTCREFGLFPAIERSRSGNGAHAWLFFDEPIEASLARDLGCTLITHAMARFEGMGFEAYDRLFPTQATIPEGGFGNLIALPFQGRAQREANSVFVDDGFVAFPDQWRFLSSVVKVTRHQVQEVVGSAAGAPLGQLAFVGRSGHVANEGERSFLSFISDSASDTIPEDFPRTTKVVKSNMLFVRKQGISKRGLNRIRRLAAFGNPEFYRAQAMHQSVYGKPRIIWCGEEDDEYIMLPRACEQKLTELVAEGGAVCVFDDRRNATTAIEADFTGELRERQREAAEDLLRYDFGVLSAPTGFGKTVIGAYLIGRLKVRTLVIVPKTNLIDQWKTRLSQFLITEDDRPPLLTKSGKPSKKKRSVIGQIGGGKNALGGLVDIATFQSLVTKDDMGIPCAKPLVADYDLVICDECQYAAAPNLELIMKSVKAKYVYGLSATPKRSDGLEGIIHMQLGPVRHKVNPKEQAAEQGMRRILLPRFSRVRFPLLEPKASFSQIVDALCKHDFRNDLLAVRRSVVVSAPYANPKLVESMLSDIVSVIARGIEVCAILKRAKSDASRGLQDGVAARLSSVGCDVRVVDAPLTGIAIFDNKVSWYGTLPLLAFAKTDDCSLRVDSTEISADLRDALDTTVSHGADIPQS